MKKRILCLLLCAVMLISVTGCGRHTSGRDQGRPSTSARPGRGESERREEERRPGRHSREPETEEPVWAEPEEPRHQETQPQLRQTEPAETRRNTLPPEAYPQNNARFYYWREQLTGDTAELYDGICLLASDPYDTGRKVEFYTQIDPGTEEFKQQLLIATIAVQYDHPEFFFLDPHAAEPDRKPAELQYLYWEKDSNGYRLEMQLENVHPQLPELIATFNAQAQAYLDMIDFSQPEAQVARQIHDLLIWNVSYDYDVYENEKDDYARTAYGALGSNTSGEAFRAVCSGYALAYHYLLQQAGIMSIVVDGNTVEENGDSDRHAWNMVQVDGQWKEVDPTWDDADNHKEEAIAGPYGYIVEEAFNDPAYYEKATHAYYMISTAQMEDYTAGEDMRFQYGNGWYMAMANWSSHRKTRQSEEYASGWLMERAPVAY